MAVAITQLRHIGEHWQTDRGTTDSGAGRRLRDAIPMANPGFSQHEEGSGWVIGNALHVDALRAWAAHMYACASIRLREVDRELVSEHAGVDDWDTLLGPQPEPEDGAIARRAATGSGGGTHSGARRRLRPNRDPFLVADAAAIAGAHATSPA